MTDGSGGAERLSYHVDLLLPPAAIDVRAALDATLHQLDQRIGVITRCRADGLSLGILNSDADADAARDAALLLVATALRRLSLDDLVSQVQVSNVAGRPMLPGGPREVADAPALSYRRAVLPDGCVVTAGSEGPLGDWYASTPQGPRRVVAGRALPEVLSELLQLPWGRKEAWFYEALAELAGHPTGDGVRYACPCCERWTMREPPPGTHEICGVCGWQDDGVQFRDPEYRGGANTRSLLEARADFARRPG